MTRTPKLSRSYNLKKIMTEAALWLLFLFVCATLGYFQGVRPDFKFADLINPPAQIHIYSFSEILLPRPVLDSIEEDTNTKITLHKINSWKALKVALIASPAPDLLLIPTHWAASLYQEGLLQDLNAIKSIMSDSLSLDFTNLNASSQPVHFFPVFWSEWSLLKSTEKIQRIQLLNDADLFLEYQNKINAYVTQPKISVQVSDFDSLVTQKDPNYDLNTKNHIQIEASKAKNNNNQILASAISIWGFAIAKNYNQSHLAKIKKIIKNYVGTEIQQGLLKQIPVASALSWTDQSQLPEFKKSAYIRKLELPQIIILKNKKLDAEEKASKASGVIFAE